MIEEWMLAANQAVARRLFSAVLDKHRSMKATADSGDETATESDSDAVESDEGEVVEDSETAVSPVRPRRNSNRNGNNKFRSQSLGTLLRRHPPPKPKKMEELIKLTAAASINMDTSSAAAIRVRVPFLSI
ncbi:unnamed protein product [Dibothriocephalus latus]|uniref:Uncharacterized protein n=1 Tax=Dibothriocephalus latus TaxID=60516 RepID=A0A3P7MIK2_DIBLA|nr:unnamed protein product [Dibothriocephalus latus]